MSNSEDIYAAIESAIEKACELFRAKPDYFLTEEDLRCHLFLNLYRRKALRKEETTRDQTTSIPIHAEVRWYGRDQSLNYRSDLVIVQVDDLITSTERQDLPSKSFGFNKFYAVIELKLRRKIDINDDAFAQEVRGEVDRLLEIREKVKERDDSAKYYIVVFDKQGNIENFRTKVKENFPPPEIMPFFYVSSL